MRVEERAGKGEHSRSVPSRGDAETPAVWREELALQPSSPLLTKTSISLFSEECRTMWNVWGWPGYLSWVSSPLQMSLLQQASATRTCCCCCAISSSQQYCLDCLCPWQIIRPCTPVFPRVSYRNKWLLKEAIGHSMSMSDMKLVHVSIAFVFVTSKSLFSATCLYSM